MTDLSMALVCLLIAINSQLQRQPGKDDAIAAYNLIAASDPRLPVISPIAGLPDISEILEEILTSDFDDDAVNNADELLAFIKQRYTPDDEVATGDLSNDDLNYGDNTLQGNAGTRPEDPNGDPTNPLGDGQDNLNG